MRSDSFRPPLELRGRYIALVPLELAHGPPLLDVARRPDVMQYLRIGAMRDAGDLERMIRDLLEHQTAGTDLPLTTCRLPAGTPIGMTRYLRIDRTNDWVEIGGTWLDPAYWRTAINTEAKLLMLRHAFEVEGVHRVQFQTDLRNERSQRAIARLGAVREGVLREDVRIPDGYRRSSVYFSILADEWPSVRRRLEQALERPWTPPA